MRLVGRIADFKNVITLGRTPVSEVSDEVVARVPGIAALPALRHAYWTRLTGADASLNIWLVLRTPKPRDHIVIETRPHARTPGSGGPPHRWSLIVGAEGESHSVVSLPAGSSSSLT